jgi:DNA-binding winged helix-turn-helix (wHTH) protein/TolB-like protein/Tfp pilus assembly protein PilF
MNEPQSHIYEFGGFRLNAAKRQLLKAEEEVVPLMPKAFDTLLYLVRNSGKIVEKDELMREIWADTIVEENNLNQNISILRKVFGEKRGEYRFIATIPGRGYKFVAEVHEVSGEKIGEETKADFQNAELDFIENPTPETVNPKLNYKIPLVIGLILLVGAVSAIYFRRQSATGKPSVKTIAVLPFKPLVAENRDEALEMGMADTLIARLSSNRTLVVRPLGSVRRFANPEQNPQNAGLELGVETVLDGNIQRWGDKIRVNVYLIRTADAATLWVGTFDEKFTDVFLVQDAISNKVATALALRLGGDEKKPSDGRGTENFEAYRFYLQGRYHALKLIPPELYRGIEFYRRAIDADPLYALAYAELATAYVRLPITSDVPPHDAFPKARKAVEKALEIDPSLAEAHIVSGWIASWYEHDWEKSEAEFRKAIELSPNNSVAHLGYSHILMNVGRHEEAVAEVKLARELDPLSLVTNALEGQVLFYAVREAEAVERLHKTFELDPDFWIAHINLAKIYIRQEKYDDALAHLAKAQESSGGNTETLSLKGYALAKAGRRAEAQATLDELESASSQKFVPPYNIALIYNALDDRDAALNWLEKAVQARDVRSTFLKIEPKWNNLRAEPRFIELMRRMNF